MPNLVSFDVIIPVYEIVNVNVSNLILLRRESYWLPRISAHCNKRFGLHIMYD